jgi:hypothetical protein
MNIKSILLGSAAALVAVSGARAADAVVMVEPEPVEYVRVCDVYGTGFFYIPGTETCLKIGGYVRMRIEAGDNASNNDADYGNVNSPIATGLVFGAAGNDRAGFSNDDYNVSTRVRARLNFDAREETELGTLRAFARVQATNRSGAGNGYEMDNAFIQLGGLTMGYKDSLFAERDGLFIDNDFSLGDFSQNVITYTYAANGFSAALSLEDDASGDIVPDVVGQLAYEGAWGEAYVSGVYDEQTSNTAQVVSFGGQNYVVPGYGLTGLLFEDPRTAAIFYSAGNFYNGDLNDDDGAFALKAGVTLKDLVAAGSAFKIEGSYATDPTNYTNLANLVGGLRTQDVFGVNGAAGSVRDINSFTNYGNLSSEYQIGAGYQQTFGKLTASIAGVYGETFDLKFAELVTPTTFREVNLGSAEYFSVGGNVAYALTSNFSVMGEVTYFDIDLPTGLKDQDQTRGFLEFKRSF